jgi:hypothetical protein
MRPKEAKVLTAKHDSQASDDCAQPWTVTDY